jgi:BTB/POZ domain-containing protein KCTD9
MATRLSYEQSCDRLCKLRLFAHDARAPRPEQLPRNDDEEPLGVNIFRTRLAGDLDLSDLSLPRTFLGRSEINGVSFRNTDLHESNLCWNNFVRVDFTEADLGHSDMRSSRFIRVRFVATNLQEADLRRSTFVDCIFEGAFMRGAALTPQQGETIHLSEAQKREINWRDLDGPEPDGG